MWATVGFPIGFLACGAVWLAAGIPFPIETGFPLGVLLLLVLPYSLLEAAGHAIDDTERQHASSAGWISRVRLALVGAGLGVVCLPLQLAALWVVAPWEWALVAIWLVFPLVATVGLAVIGKRLVRG
jgi:hypothetical protein